MKNLPGRTVVICALAVVAACGSEATAPDASGNPTVLEIQSGQDQSGTVTSTLSSQLVVRVVDETGAPVPDVEVGWSVEAEGGTVEPVSPRTSGSGTVRADWTLGTRSGEFQATATAAGLEPVVFLGTARPDSPTEMVLLSGEGQQAVVGSHFPEPIRLRLTDQYDNPVDDRIVLVSVEEGDGWFVGGVPRTDEEGIAEIIWYAGTEPGAPQLLSLQASGFSATIEGEALPAVAGTSYLGHREFVEYIPGTLPFVITAPHGGLLEPADIPDRTWGTMVRDFATDEIAYRIGDALEDLTGARPHLIILHLRRPKLDANREIVEAAQGNPEAERAWYEFHHLTETAKAAVLARHGTGFYMDLHGHSKHESMELGYVLTWNDLLQDDESLDTGTWAVNKSSLRTLGEASPLPFSELVRGATSLGGLLAEEGYAAIPSPAQPAPTSSFFSGGPNTRRHGCGDGGPICGYQLELNREGVRNTPEERQAFAEAHARIMKEFFVIHYGIDLSQVGTLAGAPLR